MQSTTVLKMACWHVTPPCWRMTILFQNAVVRLSFTWQVYLSFCKVISIHQNIGTDPATLAVTSCSCKVKAASGNELCTQNNDYLHRPYGFICCPIGGQRPALDPARTHTHAHAHTHTHTHTPLRGCSGTPPWPPTQTWDPWWDWVCSSTEAGG